MKERQRYRTGRKKIEEPRRRHVIACVGVLVLAMLLNGQPERENGIRSRLRQLLAGDAAVDAMLQDVGERFDDGGLAAVFSPERSGETLHVLSQTVLHMEREDNGQKEFVAEVLERAGTDFPDEVDEVVHIIDQPTIIPVQGTVTSAFGMRKHPITGEMRLHHGLDIAAPEGTDILAYAAGKVTECGESSYGKYIVVNHDDGFCTMYAHCSRITAKEGDRVQCGQKIAEVGATGVATGNHLHFELWRAGKLLDPQDYLVGL